MVAVKRWKQRGQKASVGRKMRRGLMAVEWAYLLNGSAHSFWLPPLHPFAALVTFENVTYI